MIRSSYGVSVDLPIIIGTVPYRPIRNNHTVLPTAPPYSPPLRGGKQLPNIQDHSFLNFGQPIYDENVGLFRLENKILVIQKLI